MNEDKMNELLAQAARDYNEPGLVPRDEMWARIRAERAARAEATKAPVVKRRWQWMSAAAAAAIILTVGIVIGRRLERTGPVAAPNVASRPITAPKQDSASTVVAAQDTIVPQLRDETRKTGQRVQELARTTPRSTEGTNADAGLTYRLVMLRHVAGSEAMITAFRASARRGEMVAEIGSWARELLGTTRTLEAMPTITADPVMKRLLEDLDLVLVQIAQYVTRGTVDTQELDLIEQSITKRGVLTQLRSTLPVRTSAGT
jgi:hypothetical protein